MLTTKNVKLQVQFLGQLVLQWQNQISAYIKHMHTHTHTHTCSNSCKTLIGVHEMHG